MLSACFGVRVSSISLWLAWLRVSLFGGWCLIVGWENSDRHDRLPSDWAKRRRVVLERCGYRCEWDLGGGVRCGERATDVDHIRRGDDHSFANLRGLCAVHHARKSAGEGWAERQRLLKVSRGKFRRVEVHPAFL